MPCAGALQPSRREAGAFDQLLEPPIDVARPKRFPARRHEDEIAAFPGAFPRGPSSETLRELVLPVLAQHRDNGRCEADCPLAAGRLRFAELKTAVHVL